MTEQSIETLAAETGAKPRYVWAIAPAVFAGLTLAMFFDVLFSGARVVSSETTDLSLQFIAWRDFGFSQLRQGNLPLWNPHVYGGAPYFAGFQSALLYPPNWLHLIMPVGVALNWIIALHVFLAGYFTYLWCRGRGIAIGGGILAGIVFMFCGPYFLHIYAGHPPHLAVMVWTPLMLLTIDRLSRNGDLRWALLGVLAAAMQILAGHPQYVYYTGIALVCYTVIQLVGSPHRVRLAGGLVVMYVGAVLLTAIQLLPGISAANEQVRSGGLDYQIASTFSLPVANLLTLIVPSFFGSMPLSGQAEAAAGYWGAGYLWELSLFVSITALSLALLAIIREASWRMAALLLMLGVLLVLALGRHTPLYQLLYNHLPYYNSFRGTVKFAYLIALFLAMLAGTGLDSLLRERRVSWFYVYGLLIASLAVLILGAVVWGSALQGEQSGWADFIKSTREAARQSHELFLPFESAHAQAAGERAGLLTCLAAGMIALVAITLWLARFHRLVPYALILLAGLEMFVFARSTRATMDPSTVTQLPPAWQDAFTKLPVDQRVLVAPPQFINLGMITGFENLNGYDPGILKRFAELFYYSQGVDPAQASQYLPIRQFVPGIFRMLRCGLVAVDPNQPPMPIPNPLPVAVLVSDCIKLDRRDVVFSYMTQPGFDPSDTAVIESPVGIKTESLSAPPGTVAVKATSTDALEITADLTRPALLVVTNNYSTGWRVEPMTAGQAEYRIMPANYTQIGIPLEKGRHSFVLEYSPAAFRIGRWVSGISLIVVSGTTYFLMRRGRSSDNKEHESSLLP